MDASPSTVVPANCSIARSGAVHRRRVVRGRGGDLVQRAEVLRGERHVEAGEVVLEVVQPAGAEDGHDGARAGPQPGQRHRRRGGAELVGDRGDGVDDRVLVVGGAARRRPCGPSR